MGIIEIIFIGAGLAMDAFAVSVTDGMCAKKGVGKLFGGIMCGVVFGLFQAVMPTIGYALGMRAGHFLEKADHWIALFLLGFIGIKMMLGADEETNKSGENLSLGVLLIQGFATSLDALAVGISFAALSVNILLSALIIGAVTLTISFVGFMLGNKFKSSLGTKAELVGGLILLIIGLKIFIEHSYFA